MTSSPRQDDLSVPRPVPEETIGRQGKQLRPEVGFEGGTPVAEKARGGEGHRIEAGKDLVDVFNEVLAARQEEDFGGAKSGSRQDRLVTLVGVGLAEAQRPDPAACPPFLTKIAPDERVNRVVGNHRETRPDRRSPIRVAVADDRQPAPGLEKVVDHLGDLQAVRPVERSAEGHEAERPEPQGTKVFGTSLDPIDVRNPTIPSVAGRFREHAGVGVNTDDLLKPVGEEQSERSGTTTCVEQSAFAIKPQFLDEHAREARGVRRARPVVPRTAFVEGRVVIGHRVMLAATPLPLNTSHGPVAL